MFLKSRLGLVGLLAILAISSCRTQGEHEVKDEQSDLLRNAAPPGLVSRVVPSEDIPKYVSPGDGSNGVPESFNGIWWTDAKTVQFVVSFKNAVWNPANRTASITFVGPQTYVRRPNTNHSIPNRSGLDFAEYESFSGYDIVFNEDLDEAVMYLAYTDENGNREIRNDVPGWKGGDLRLRFVEDGIWERASKGKDSYMLRRIIDKDGKKEAAFADFLRIFGPKAQLFEPAIVLGGDRREISVPVKAGQETYVVVKGWKRTDVWESAGQYVVSYEAPFPVELRSFNRSRWEGGSGTGNSVKLLAIHEDNEAAGTVLVKSQQDGEVKLKIAAGDPIPLLDQQLPVTLNLKANEPGYLMFVSWEGGWIETEASGPTEIWFNAFRSVGREGKSNPSLWVKREVGLGDHVMIKAKSDGQVKVKFVPDAKHKVISGGILQPNGQWVESMLPDMTTGQTWKVNLPLDSKKKYEVEIQELYKVGTAELSLGKVSREESAASVMRTNYWLKAKISEVEDPGIDQVIRMKPTKGSNMVIVFHASSRQIPRKDMKYRIRAVEI